MMSTKLIIFYIDYEDIFLSKISAIFKKEFKNYELSIQNHNSNIIENISDAINKEYTIPIVFIGDKYLDKFGSHVFYDIKKILNLANIIFLSSFYKINNISKNIKNIGFYTYITKQYLKKNLSITICDAIKNYNMNLQIDNSYKKDTLTGLLNRDSLLKELSNTKKHSILLINIDDFRNINYSFGYKSGDVVLKQFSLEVQKISPYYTYRLLSDEFVILFDNKTDAELYELAEKIKSYIQNKDFVVDSEYINLTVSIAISKHSDSIIEDAREAIRNSMMIQKNSIVYVPLSTENSEPRFSTKQLRLAFAKDKIIPFYQGIRNNKTGNIDKYECLVRLKDEDGKFIPPNQFLELAQDVGLMSKLTRRVIHKSFIYFSKKLEDFSINLTEDDLKEQYLIDFLIEASNKYNIDLCRVTFEILENINVENSSLLFEQIKKMKELGCKIAFDDFGCEKSNFSRLLDMNIDIVKIDSMFIKNLHNNNKSYKLTKAITRLAKDFDCEVVAEGVECKEVQTIIEELGIDYTQGFYYSKPKEYIN